MVCIYFLPFSITVSFLPILPPFVSFSLLSIFSPPLFAYSPLLHHLTHPFSLCLPQTPGCISPPAGCMTGEQVERRANDKSLSLSLPASLSLSLHLTRCPATGPPQPSFLPPFSTFPSYLTTLIFKSARAAFHLLSPRRSHQTTKGERGWASVPTPILKPQTCKSGRVCAVGGALQHSHPAHWPKICDEISWRQLIKDCETA